MKQQVIIFGLLVAFSAFASANEYRENVQGIVEGWLEDYDAKFRPNLGGKTSKIATDL